MRYKGSIKSKAINFYIKKEDVHKYNENGFEKDKLIYRLFSGGVNVNDIYESEEINKFLSQSNVNRTVNIQSVQENNIAGEVINRTKDFGDVLREQESAEFIRKMVDVRIQSNIKNISKEVYDTIERRLQREKRRRGF